VSAPLGRSSERQDFFAHRMYKSIAGSWNVRWGNRMAGVLIAQVLVGPPVAMPLQATTGNLSQLKARRQTVIFASNQKNRTADTFDWDRGALD
jgi:hypothetical protein